MIKVINKVTKEVRMVNETYFEKHKTQFEVYVEPVVEEAKDIKKELKDELKERGISVKGNPSIETLTKMLEEGE